MGVKKNDLVYNFNKFFEKWFLSLIATRWVDQLIGSSSFLCLQGARPKRILLIDVEWVGV